MIKSQFSIDFKMDDDFIFIVDKRAYINLYPVLKKHKNSKDGLLVTLRGLIEKFDLDSEYITSGSPFNELVSACDGFKYLDDDDIDLLKQIICECYLLTTSYKKIEWVFTPAGEVNFSDPGLYIRYGNVELRVLENWLRDEQRCLDSLDTILNYLDDEDFMLQPMNSDNLKWLSAGDFIFNLKALMTNAGFYLSNDPNKAKDDLKNWCTKYYNGLKMGSLFLYPAADPFFFNVRKRIESDNKSIVQYNFFPQPENFFKMLKGKRVLIVSPFKTLLEKMVSESRLKNLYKNFLIDDTSFHFIEAPISIYPNRPGNSWTESYQELYDNTSKIIESCHIDIFMASCGCYGIPLTTDVYENLGISSVYYGNWLNTLFGIRQACSMDFGTGLINEEMRISSDLGKFKNLNLIDGGRYI